MSLVGQDIIDSRDVIEAIEDLESQIEDLESQIEDIDDELNDEYNEDLHDDRIRMSEALVRLSKELKPLKDLEDDACGSPDWVHGETLINDDYFVQYTKDLVEDCYDFPDLSGWPFRHLEMDWESAATELQQDYMDVDFDGETYWIRC